METNRDLILRNLKYFSDFLQNLTKQRPKDIEVINFHVNEFLKNNKFLDTEDFLNRTTNEIINIFEKNNLENIRDLADIFFLNYCAEIDLIKKEKLNKKTIELFQFYQKNTPIYSYDTELKINLLMNNKFG